jgi:polysaccharide export outer membrane protein
MSHPGIRVIVTLLGFTLVSGMEPARAQTPAAAPSSAAGSAPAVVVSPDYVIGPEDVLGVLFWREQDMSGDVQVRPDGMITLPLIGDMAAAGLRPDALKAQIEEAAARFLTEPNASVVVRAINSRKVFITGEIVKPGEYPLTAPRTVMQLIALAGGLNEYADANNIIVMRMENGAQRSFKFRCKDVAKGRGLEQNVMLLPGDTVVVP